MALPVSAGGILLASDVNALNDPSWISYGAAGTILTSATTSPTLGNSTWAAAYMATSKLVHMRFNITIGSTFSAGSGAYLLLLPVAASVGAMAATVGTVWMDDGGATPRAGVAYAADSTHVSMFRDSVAGGLGSTGPGSAWATGDRFAVSYSYEPA